MAVVVAEGAPLEVVWCFDGESVVHDDKCSRKFLVGVEVEFKLQSAATNVCVFEGLERSRNDVAILRQYRCDVVE